MFCLVGSVVVLVGDVRRARRELDDLHRQLAFLYRLGVSGAMEQSVVDGYWREIELLESVWGPVGGGFRWR